MPAKVKNAPCGNEPRDQRDQRREPAAARKRKCTLDDMAKAIAKEDARIIAKASARALRRGLH